MKHGPSNDPDDGFAVEITALDAPETHEHASDALLQGSRLAPRVRTWLTILSAVGGILLVVVVLSPLLSSLWPKKTSTPLKLHLPPAQIQDVTVQNGVAYITSSDGTLRALRVKSGSLLWQRNLAGVAPLFINDIMYIAYHNQNNIIVQALRVSNGAVLWTFKTALDINPLIIENGVAYGPFTFSAQQGRMLTALDGKNGAELWQYTINILQSSLVSIQGMQDKVYITVWANAQVQDMSLSVLSTRTGSLLWHLKAPNVQIIQNNVVCIITKEGVLKVLRADNGHEVWHYKSTGGSSWSPITGNNLFYVQTQKGSLQALRIDNGTVQWTYNDPWGVATMFPEVDGVLYLETSDNFIVALRTSDGTLLWHVRPVAPPFTFGSVEVVGGIAYAFATVGDQQYGTVVALNAIDGSLLWKRKIDTYNNGVPPQVSNNLLFADSGSVVTALRARDGAVLWHASYAQSSLQYNPNLWILTENVVVMRSSGGVLVAHQAETGAVLWRYPRAASS